MKTMNDITPIPALRDNYIWALYNTRYAVVVDPGEAAPVLSFLKQHHLDLNAILCTHHHSDHTSGIAELCEVYNVPVYAPHSEDIPRTTHPLDGGETIELTELGIRLNAIDIPGHTRGHLAFQGEGYVFCGDTLFGCGCGRIFEGTAEQMLNALKRLARLPDDTRVYCAHEYTEANIRFALACEPENEALRQRATDTRAMRIDGRPSLPSTIRLEKATNPFLRCSEASVIQSVQRNCGINEQNELPVFMALRKWKDHF